MKIKNKGSGEWREERKVKKRRRRSKEKEWKILAYNKNVEKLEEKENSKERGEKKRKILKGKRKCLPDILGLKGLANLYTGFCSFLCSSECLLRFLPHCHMNFESDIISGHHILLIFLNGNSASILKNWKRNKALAVHDCCLLYNTLPSLLTSQVPLRRKGNLLEQV
jgi:hypothetical protein